MMELDRKGLFVGFTAAAFVCLMIVLGSRGLKYFDLALTPYAFAIVFAAFAVTYRYVVWLQRPPTRLYWGQGWRLFLKRPVGNLLHLGRLLFDNFAAQRFIGRRSPVRWMMHFCLSWGVMIAFAITFPLVFGWIHFETPVESPSTYRLLLFGIGVLDFAPNSLFAFLIFNGLNLSAILVIAGLLLALQLRMQEPGKIALQQFGNDVVPLLILFIVAITGLGLTVSARWLNGHGYAFISLTHAASVVALLLYLPFGKFFHIFQRAAQLGVAFYKLAGRHGEQARCGRCGEPFASRTQVEDLKQVLGELGIDYRLDGPAIHYQEICPGCRRRLVTLNQGRLLGR